MEQTYLEKLKDMFDYSDNHIFLHNALTVEDINNMAANRDEDKTNSYTSTKRLKHFSKNIFTPFVSETRSIKCTDNINCLSFAVSVLPNSPTTD